MKIYLRNLSTGRSNSASGSTRTSLPDAQAEAEERLTMLVRDMLDAHLPVPDIHRYPQYALADYTRAAHNIAYATLRYVHINSSLTIRISWTKAEAEAAYRERDALRAAESIRRDTARSAREAARRREERLR